MTKLDVLLKSFWVSRDIQDYYNCSKNTADEIKKVAESHDGIILADRESGRRAVSADVVIQVMGGTSRLNELQIMNEYKKLGGN